MFANNYLDVYNKVFNFINEKNNVNEKYFNENFKNYFDFNKIIIQEKKLNKLLIQKILILYYI